MIDIYAVDAPSFRIALAAARAESDRIAAATSAPAELPEDGRYFLSEDLDSGFGVNAEGDLIGLFSLVKGRGSDLIGWAIRLGAETLDCFDGFLPTLYGRHGFRETRREQNWTPGGPDVVFMARV
jgi:hypothetical protein